MRQKENKLKRRREKRTATIFYPFKTQSFITGPVSFGNENTPHETCLRSR